MKYPPLQDPEPADRGPARDPSAKRDESSAPTTAGDAGAPAVGPKASREPMPAPPPPAGDAARADTPIYAGPPSSDDEEETLDEDEASDDEFAELIERVDLDDLEALDDGDEADADDDGVEVPTLTDEPDPEPDPEPDADAEPERSAAAGQSPADAGGIAARHRIGGNEPIPMLTEVVQVPRYDTEDLPQSLAEVDWGDLAQRVRENVLERLLRRSDALLDAQLQDTLVPVLERAAETVAHELHDALNRMIRDIVARAVTEELTRLHAEIAKRNRSRPR